MASPVREYVCGERCASFTTSDEKAWITHLTSGPHLQAAKEEPWVDLTEVEPVDNSVFFLSSYAFVSTPPYLTLQNVIELLNEEYFINNAYEDTTFGYKMVKMEPRTSTETRDVRMLFLKGYPMLLEREASLTEYERSQLYKSQERANERKTVIDMLNLEMERFNNFIPRVNDRATRLADLPIDEICLR